MKVVILTQDTEIAGQFHRKGEIVATKQDIGRIIRKNVESKQAKKLKQLRDSKEKGKNGIPK